MEYTVSTPELLGDVIPLYSVALSLSKTAASAGNRGFNKKAFDGNLPGYISDLIHAAEAGTLQVCNRRGRVKTLAELIAKMKLNMARIVSTNDETVTIAINAYVRLKHLNDWAKELGDVFQIRHDGVSWLDERGWSEVIGSSVVTEASGDGTISVFTIKIQEDSDARDAPNPEEIGAANHNRDSRKPACHEPKPDKSKPWIETTMPYMIKIYKSGQYVSAKQFFNALIKNAGGDSPFDIGTGQNRGALIIRQTKSTLSVKTIQNSVWRKLTSMK